MVDIPGFPDVGALIRRLLQGAQAELVTRLLRGGGSIILAETEALRARADAIVSDWIGALAALPHNVADFIADLDRGPDARVLTTDETRLVREAYGDRQPPSVVRIVKGSGLSLPAMLAFRKGNPAITIGNTIYIKAEYQVPHQDLSTRDVGVELLLHEFTHVIQWKTMGYTGFGRRYLSDIHDCGMDQLYDYEKRNTVYAQETLEGQAQMVGHYARVRLSPNNPNSIAKRQDLERRLKGTGIYGL